jgi:hypothetical protein
MLGCECVRLCWRLEARVTRWLCKKSPKMWPKPFLVKVNTYITFSVEKSSTNNG